MTSEFPLVPVTNPVFEALALGQSIWYDNLRRSLLTSGQLTRMVSQDGLRGITSNPSIFDKAIEGSTDYAASLEEMRRNGTLDAKAAYEELAFSDITSAADVLHSVYDASSRQDGYVSLEVPPHLAHNSSGTISEAVRIWNAIDRPNLMVKVPGTPEGISAFREIISRGICVNVTLLFSVQTYGEVARAYLDGLEKRLAAGQDISSVASVASFFISRIDSAVDPLVSAGLKGTVGISSAKVAYSRFREILNSDRWKRLADAGAMPQRLLWASTSTKNPAYPELMYIEALMGPWTVNTVPPATYESFRATGKVAPTLEEGLDEAEARLVLLSSEGISLQAVTDKLLDEGLRAFEESFEKLLTSVENSLEEFVPSTFPLEMRLPEEIEQMLEEVVQRSRDSSLVERIWSRDRRVWSGTDEDKWLGWLSNPMDQRSHPHHFRQIAKMTGGGRFHDAVVLGMGGSSLCTEALSLTLDQVAGFPRLSILDSTDPVQIKTLEERLDLSKTLFFVSSKSGTTLEPNIYADYFYERTKEVVGSSEAGSRFIAITDPGSSLEARALTGKWRGVYHGVPSIGGRYSALSDFGMIPGAAAGFKVLELLDRAEAMAHACAASVPLHENPGFMLGALLGICAGMGRDKVTICTSNAIFDLSAWLSQLLAESTGKDGKGIIPVDGEPLGAPDVYGNDRLFVHIRLLSDIDPEDDRKIDALAKAGHPVCRIDLNDSYDLGREFFRWEFATAVAGAIIGIDPFDQPDVEDAKVKTRDLAQKYEDVGSLPNLEPLLVDGRFVLYADPVNSSEISTLASGQGVGEYLRAHFSRARPGDYAAFLAYLPMTVVNESKFTRIRSVLRDHQKVATCVGFGPRFQHSTGQAYKGGPNTGVFLQVTCDDAADIAVPGHHYSFGFVKEAQARGDFDVLAERGRRVLRIHLRGRLESALDELCSVLENMYV